MTDENTADLCEDCGPTFTAFLEGMAGHNQEQMELNAKSHAQHAVRSMNPRFRFLRKRRSSPTPLPDERDFCNKKSPDRALSTIAVENIPISPTHRNTA